jgi:hypothetical protein
MNNRPEQWDWPEPVQDEMSAEDFEMILQEMAKSSDYEAGRARRLAAVDKIFGIARSYREIPADGLKFMRGADWDGEA